MSVDNTAQTKRGQSDEQEIEHIERLKSSSVSQLLFKTARQLNEHALAALRSVPGAPPVRAAHTALFPHIDHEGTRLGRLAERMGISKQAVGQLVDELESWGVVQRRDDPDDRRAKRVHFVRGGSEGLERGLAHLLTIDAEVAGVIGVRRTRELASTLRELLAWLDEAD